MASDAELDHFREAVDCRTVLGRAGWKVDAAESTAAAVKFRRGEGEILIVTHDGRGWFDPLAEGLGLNEERGDVIALDQKLHGGSLGHVRKRLRQLSGVQPPRLVTTSAAATGALDNRQPTPAEPGLRWRAAEPPRPGSAGWRYLNEERGIPDGMIAAAVQAGALREGIYGTVWGAHRDRDGEVTGWEMRGPKFRGFSKGGDKGLFAIGDARTAERLMVAEAMIDAMSLAAIDAPEERQKAVYLSTGGGFGPHTEAALRGLLRRHPGLSLVAATDRGIGGDRLADRLARLAAEAGALFTRRTPPHADDWNDELRSARGLDRGAPAASPRLSLVRE